MIFKNTESKRKQRKGKMEQEVDGTYTEMINIIQPFNKKQMGQIKINSEMVDITQPFI